MILGWICSVHLVIGLIVLAWGLHNAPDMGDYMGGEAKEVTNERA